MQKRRCVSNNRWRGMGRPLSGASSPGIKIAEQRGRER
jgi:hypothetical protein